MPQKYPTPIPIFDNLDNIAEQKPPALAYAKNDFKLAVDFLKQYYGSEATFTAYRREMERVLQWPWLIAKKSILKLKRADIEDYIKFCQKGFFV